ncbi:MAG: hypothetical protein Q8941_07745 [Bacteroidota bacterium]|nr:hypothetical protein [Bacteroidota bacterium]
MTKHKYSMGLFDFLKRPEKPIDFSDKNVEALTKLSDQLGDTFIKAGYGFGVDYLSQIRLAADRHDNEAFKKLVISRELFGGSGAIWEIWFENKQLRTQFNKQFCEYVDLLKKMGIRNRRVNQVRSYFDRFEHD